MSRIIGITYKTNGYKTERWLKKNTNIDLETYARMCGERGVEALANATPRKTGLTANSWSYSIEKDISNSTLAIVFKNSNVVDEWFNVAIMLQYGHATGSGVWVEGIDYINPALKDIFNDISNDLWKEVTSNE